MTALPLSNSLAKVKSRLPVRITGIRTRMISVIDKNGEIFCSVPNGRRDVGTATAKLIRDAMNQMRKDEA